MTDRLDLDGLQVERYISKNYTSRVIQALNRCFFSVFSENLGKGGSTIFRISIMTACMYQRLLGFMSFILNLKNKIAKIS